MYACQAESVYSGVGYFDLVIFQGMILEDSHSTSTRDGSADRAYPEIA